MRALSAAWVLIALWAFGLGCGPDRSAPVRLALAVTDDRGDPLAEVPLLVGDHVVATSDARGRALLGFPPAAPPAQLRAACPEAYRPAAAVQVDQAVGRPLRFVCRPKLRTLAVVAYVPHARGAMLRADDQALGRIGADGTLHAVLRRAPGVTLQLKLDALEAPARQLRVADRDQIIVFDPGPAQ